VWKFNVVCESKDGRVLSDKEGEMK
jgi:hypothetical protein